MAEIAKISNKKLYVDKKSLGTLLGVSARQIENYQVRTVPLLRSVEHSSRKATYFEVWYALDWYKNNVDYERLESTKNTKAMAVLSGKTEQKDAEKAEKDISKITESEAKRRNEIAKLRFADIKIEKELGILIPAEDVDRAMAEQAVLHKTDKVNDEKILPVMLENKSIDEIADLLYTHNMESLKRYDKLIKKEFKSEATLYDIIEVTIKQLADGEEPDDIIKRITG